MYENISVLRPYFFSLREIDNNVSLDIKLPLTWKFDKIVEPYRSVKTKVQDKNDKFSLLSLISTATIEGYEVVFACAKEIITINMEEEEKLKLFQEKVNELKLLFQHQSLNKLKNLNFIEEHGQTDTTGDGMVEQGD